MSGLFAGTEYEGLGSIAPMAKLIDDRHVISRLREKSEEQNREIEELKRQNGEWQQKYETAVLLQDFLDKTGSVNMRKLLWAVRKQPSVVKTALKFL